MYRPENDLRFRVIEPLGRGGTAKVVRVFHHHLKREAALKFELEQPQDNVSFSALAQREYQLVGKLRYPGLVRLLEPPRDAHSLVLELCQGPTLDSILPITDLKTALNVLSSIAINLEYIRAAELVHGDLKPQNIFLPSNWPSIDLSGGEYTKLSDFSLGRRSSETEDARLGLGTVGYMAPETTKARKTSHRSDLFALGVIAYQVLTGVHPFMQDETEPVRISSRIQEEDPEPISSFRTDLPDSVIQLVSDLLSKNETDRPDCALTVCERLKNSGADYPYERAIRPSLLFRAEASYDDNVKRLLAPEGQNHRELLRLTGRSNLDLRLILAYTFLRRQLTYSPTGFRVLSRLYWPPRLRNRYLSGLGRQEFSERKRLLRRSVGSFGEASDTAVTNDPDKYPQAVMDLFLRLMRPSTIRRIAKRLASEAEADHRFEAATRYSVMSGELEAASRCSLPATRQLSEDERGGRALALLSEVVELSELQGQLFGSRHIVMQRADLYKELGDIDRALGEYNKIVALYDGKPEDHILAETYKDIGAVYRQKRNNKASLSALRQALTVYQRLGDDLEISHVTHNIGNVYWIESNMPEALRCYRKALNIQRRIDEKAAVASTLNNIATIFCLDGRVKRGKSLLDIALKLKREEGHLGEIARTLNNLGFAHNLLGEIDQAAHCLEESLTINQRIGSKDEILFNLENLISLLITSGEIAKATGYVKQSIELSQASGFINHVCASKIRRATIMKRTGRYGEAKELLDEATKLAAEISDAPLSAEAKIQYASLRHFIGDSEEANTLALEALAEARDSKNQPIELDCHLMLARVADRPGEFDRGLRLIEDLHLVRERHLLIAAKLQFHLASDSSLSLSDELNALIEFVQHRPSDIETPWILNLISEKRIAEGFGSQAEEYIAMSKELASIRKQLPEQGVALILEGRLAEEQHGYEAAYSAYRQALAVYKKMTQSIPDQADRKLFQSSRSVQFLAGQISLLSSKLNRK